MAGVPVICEYGLVDRNGRELLAYHWQLGPMFLGPYHPHLHVSAALHAQVDTMDRRGIGLDKVHLVTGIVTLAGFVWMLIEEFGVASLRYDWRDVLDRIDAALRDG